MDVPWFETACLHCWPSKIVSLTGTPVMVNTQPCSAFPSNNLNDKYSLVSAT